MADKKIKHFIFMRFFNLQSLDYPYNVLHVDFLSKNLIVAKNNALKSLENQTDKNFDLVFMLHDRVFWDKRYEFIFSELQNATTLPLKFIKVSEQGALVKEALKEYDFVIQSRMDFDDFLYKDAIADTHAKTDECDAGILAYGYCKGYTYVLGELYEHYKLWNNRGHHSVLQSLILKSSFAKDLPYFGIYNDHPRFKLSLENFLKKNGIKFSENMFQQNTSANAYIYYRHEYSRDSLSKNYSLKSKISRKKPLTTADITKKQLEEEFGFVDHELKSIE